MTLTHGAVILASLAVQPLFSQTLCDGQILPIKPWSLSCPNPTPVCISSGQRGRWSWGCAAQIPQQQSWQQLLQPPAPPPVITPADPFEAERIRAVRSENAQRAQELKQPSVEPPAARIAPLPDAQQSNLIMIFKLLYTCGVSDGILKESSSAANPEAANIMREAIRKTGCEDIRKYVGVEPPEPSKAGHQ